ncbi:MAG: hypothetical protein IJ874_01430 [Ruminococcus sp.]|nr:hypothetical protein [Ruminococcus sp.]
MTYLLNNIDEAVDRKFLVTKTISGQAEAGTLVHIMSGVQDGSGVSITYRVGNTFQDYNAKFGSLNDFCKWARPDNFIARHYEKLDTKDIQQYIRVIDKSFVSSCLPILAAAIIIVWLLALLLVHQGAHIAIGIVVGVCMSVLVAFLVIRAYNNRRTKVMTRLYSKIGSGWAGGGISIT